MNIFSDLIQSFVECILVATGKLALYILGMTVVLGGIGWAIYYYII